MKLIYPILCSLLLSLSSLAAGEKDSLALKTKTTALLPSAVPLSRTFKQLDNQLEAQHASYGDQKSAFTKEYIAARFAVDSTLQDLLAPAVGTFNTLDESGNYVDVLTPADLVSLPVGLRETIAGVQYVTGISGVRFVRDYYELTVFVKVVIPQGDGAGGQRELFFGGNHIKLSPAGGFIGDAHIVLLGDVPIRIGGGNGLVILRGGINMSSGAIQDRSFVSIDCDGFKSLSLAADVEFPRSMMEPIDANYQVIPGENNRVRGHFQTTASDWNDILVEISLPRFQLTSFKGTVFEVNTAIFDFSDLRNASGMVWPPNYQQYLMPGQHSLWRGIYVSSLKVVLPKAFRRKNSEQRITFDTRHMLIDGMGVSGNFAVNNLLPIDEGSASGWAFSVDRFEVSFGANQLIGGSFHGGIVLPISKISQAEDSLTAHPSILKYSAIINPQNKQYVLSAGLGETLDFDLFSAKASLDPNSRIEMRVKDGVFRPRAILHGRMDIAADQNSDQQISPDDEKTVAFKGILFQGLELQTEMPYLRADYFGYQGDVVKLANFPVSISNIGLSSSDRQATLEFDLAINLMEDQFNGQTRLGVVGKFVAQQGLQRWTYERLDLEEITIGADFSGMRFDGRLILRDNDPVYGDGFAADVNIAFEGLGDGSATMQARGIFGKTNYRYWSLEVLANNLNINAGGALVIKGFGGGASYRMKKVNLHALGGGGTSFFPTGVRYQPDDKNGLGVKAALYFANQVNTDVFNGGAGFEMAFNSGGGLNRVSIFGEAHFMQSFAVPGVGEITDQLNAIQNAEGNFSAAVLDAVKESDLIEASKTLYPASVEGTAGINAYAAIEYDFNTQSLHGNFDVYIDTAEGLLRGRASGNRAGWAVVHFSPEKWYIHMGTPTDRLGIKMGIGAFTVESGGYFMIGDEIPGSPSPPPVVADILGFNDLQSLNYMRDENALSSGRGMAFGADFSVDTGDMKFLIFYARFQAGAGFDIMVKDYGETECKSSGQIGMNGWYANGQAYAYLQGELGIRIKLFMLRKKIPIIKAGAAVLMQAKLPNPAWFRGYLGGHYSLLGGLVRGQYRFKIEIGKECELMDSSPLEGIKIIADVSPTDNSDEVDVFAIPQAAFNMALNSPFELEDDDGNIKQYRIVLKEFKVYDGNGQQLPAGLTWNENRDLASFRSTDILPPETVLIARVKVAFEEKQGSIWQLIYQDGHPVIEQEEVTFTTGTAPDYIPMENILYAYPMPNQQYVYPEEHPEGYIALKRGQPYLFDGDADQMQQAIFTDQSGNITKVEGLRYYTDDKRLQFELPELTNQQSYSFSLLTLPPLSGDENIAQTYTEHELEDGGSTVAIKSTDINSVAHTEAAIMLLEYAFATSAHDTFADKITAKSLTEGFRELIYSDVHALRAAVSPSEAFSKAELSGSVYSEGQALMIAEAVLEDAYFIGEIHPMIYNDYPLDGDLRVDRDTQILGFPPTKAMDKLSWYETYLESDPSNSFLRSRMPYRYHLPYYYKADFIDLQYKIVNRYLQNPERYQGKIQQYNYIINGSFPYIKPGNYKVHYRYRLPGGIMGSLASFHYNNPL